MTRKNICGLFQRGALFFASILFVFSAITTELQAQGRARITRRLDNNVVVRLQNTTHPSVRLSRELGRVPAGFPMERILLQLNGSPEQEASLQQLLAEQQDPPSPQHHAWLTPEDFGVQFGGAQADLDAIAGWLQ